MNAEADTVLPVADPDCVSLENSVLHILTSKPDLSCRNCNKDSCIAYCIGTIERRRVTSRYMVALSLEDNKTNDDGDGKENGKRICLY